jgi:hypothetical protein
MGQGNLAPCGVGQKVLREARLIGPAEVQTYKRSSSSFVPAPDQGKKLKRKTRKVWRETGNELTM